MADERKELEELRRIDELEKKAAGGKSAAELSFGEKTKLRLPSMFTTAPQPEAEAAGSLATLRGLSSSILGIGGAMESAEPAKDVRLRGQETTFASPETIRGYYSKLGFKEPEKEELKAAQFAGEISPLVIPAGKAAIEGIGKGGSALADYLSGKYAALKGVKPAPLAQKTSSELERLTAQQTEKLSETEKKLKQLQQQPTIAEQRAKTTSISPEAASALQLPVREKLGARVSQAATTEQIASKRLDQANKELQASTAAVNAVEQRMASQPGITADQLGQILQPTTAKLQKDAIAARKSAAGYEKVFANAGSKPTVETKGILTNIQKVERQTRNPTLQNILSEIKSQLVTDGEKKLSLRSADSLKGYLDSVIAGKEQKYGKLDKEIVNAVQNIKNQLMMKTTTAHPDYKVAINKFREMSRPLDIVERNGALRKVIDQDPVSTMYKMTEAEVTGHVIRKANAGNPVFTRLLQTKPELKESARLYFTKELFGKDAAPTAKSFESWLLDNERSLRQTGLYEEFSTLRNAQRSAQNSVDMAKGKISSTETVFKGAKEARSAAEKLRDAASTRLSEALKTADTPETIAKKVAGMEKRAAPAVTKFTTQADKQRASLDALSELKSNLTRSTKPEEIQKNIKATAEKLKDLGLIEESQRDQLLREAAKLGNSIEDRNKALKLVGGAITATLGFGAASYGLRQYLPSIE